LVTLEEGKERSTEATKHTIPKCIFNIEKLFDLNNKFKGSPNVKNRSSSFGHEVNNLGIAKNPKNVNLEGSFYEHEKRALVKILKSYQDVFAWSYDDI
jgi:hypothetical protein